MSSILTGKRAISSSFSVGESLSLSNDNSSLSGLVVLDSCDDSSFTAISSESFLASLQHVSFSSFLSV